MTRGASPSVEPNKWHVFANGPRPVRNIIYCWCVPGLTADNAALRDPAPASQRAVREPPATAVRLAVGATQRELHSGPACFSSSPSPVPPASRPFSRGHPELLSSPTFGKEHTSWVASQGRAAPSCECEQRNASLPAPDSAHQVGRRKPASRTLFYLQGPGATPVGGGWPRARAERRREPALYLSLYLYPFLY